MEITLHGGTALVDDEDGLRVSGIDWKTVKTGQRTYAYAQIAGRTVYLHHFVLGVAPKGRGKGDIDHINGNGLDNRRSNLRRATRQQNNANSGPRAGTSTLKGVSWSARARKWQAHIMVDYRSCFLGLYSSEEDAGRAYDIAALEAFGEYARLNFPDRKDEAAPTRASVRYEPRALAPTERPQSSKARAGTANPNAKLTEDDVRAILRELTFVPRRTYDDIAQEFGVSKVLVSLIARGKAWTHVSRAS